MILEAFSKEFFKELRSLRRNKILFFNGCFDIVHIGHLKMIKEIKRYAKEHRMKIICGLNSDKSVKLQNKKHPLINDEYNRAGFLIELGIDEVIIFNEPTPKELLMHLVPDTVFKGREYLYSDFPEREYLKSINTNVEYFPMQANYSTTHIYNKVKSHVLDEIEKKVSDAINEAKI